MSNAYETKETVVAFIDVLGATAKMYEDEDKALSIVHNVYNEALKLHKHLFDLEKNKNAKLKVNIFSDNIVISAETFSENQYLVFRAVVAFAAIIQYKFLASGYLVRGGISMGNFFVDDTMLWGTALVDSYKLESSIAIYPRIVIHPKVIATLGIATNPSKQRFLMQDLDGLFFVDYLNKDLYGEEQLVLFVLAFIADVERLECEANGNLTVMQKINWHSSYLLHKLKTLPKKPKQGDLNEKI